MADRNPTNTPFETVAATVGEGTVEALALLANETRLAILLALWEAIDPDPPQPDSTLSFSELRQRVGLRHGEQFNYHLDKLVGEFVDRSESGYGLTTDAERILSVMLAGTLAEAPSFSDERIDAACMLCGAPTVVEYSDGVLTQRCSRCEGVAQDPDEPAGLIATEYRPPVGLENRTPQEFVQQGKTWHRHQRHAFIEKTCPDCSGTVSTAVLVCDDHDADRSVCGRCDRVHEVGVRFVCDICKSSMRTGVWNTVFTEVPVIAFCHEHGLDTTALEDELAYGVLYETIERVSVVSEAPIEILVTVELDGDRLDVTLDGDAEVTDITERCQETA